MAVTRYNSPLAKWTTFEQEVQVAFQQDYMYEEHLAQAENMVTDVGSPRMKPNVSSPCTRTFLFSSRTAATLVQSRSRPSTILRFRATQNAYTRI